MPLTLRAGKTTNQTIVFVEISLEAKTAATGGISSLDESLISVPKTDTQAAK